MIKIKANGLLASLGMLAMSSACLAHSTIFDGFYVGASAGGTSTNVKQDQTHNLLLSINGVFNDSLVHREGPNSQRTNNSFKGALFAGYGQTWDIYYLGAEAFVDLAHYRTHQSVNVSIFEGGQGPIPIFNDTHTKLSSFQFGADLRPGVLLTPDSMLYGRVGVAFSDLTLEDNGGLGILDFLLLPLNVSEEKDVAALRLGAGLEQRVCPRLSLRLDYIYTYYGKQDVNAVSEIVLGGDTASLNTQTSVKVYNNTAMLGLSYAL